LSLGSIEPRQLDPKALYHRFQIARHLLGLEPEDPIAKPPEDFIAASISLAPSRVVTPIHLDSEADFMGQEVNDEAAPAVACLESPPPPVLMR
jgi:hypothetical protein